MQPACTPTDSATPTPPLAEGVDIAIISRQLGHTSISTTAPYLDRIAPRAVIEAMRAGGCSREVLEPTTLRQPIDSPSDFA